MNLTTTKDYYDRHYIQRAKNFARAIADLDATGIPEPHLPIWGRNYEKSSLRVGIIGRDTRGWGEINAFLNAVHTDPAQAVHRHKERFTSMQFTTWTNNFGRTFWDTALKILAGVHDIPDWKKLKRREEKSVLESFFWANVNSIERYEVSPAENGVEWATWRKVKDASEREFDSFKTILDVFTPDVVFLMNWEPGSHYFEADLVWDVFGDHQAYAYSATTKTHVLATAHPTWLNQNSLYDEAIPAIIARAKKELTKR